MSETTRQAGEEDVRPEVKLKGSKSEAADQAIGDKETFEGHTQKL